MPDWKQDTTQGALRPQGGADEPQDAGKLAAGLTEELRASEERYRNLVETSDALIWTLDVDGRLTFVNQASRHVCGFAPEEMVGRLFTDFVPPERHEPDRANFLEAMRTGKTTIDYTTAMYHADGRLLTVRANARVIRDASGNVVGSMGTAWDVTRSVQVEEALRESLERLTIVERATNDVVWDWHLEQGTLWWNEHFQSLFGYGTDEIESGIESWTNRLHPADLDRVKTGIYAVLASSRSDWEDEYRFRRSDGSYADILDRGYVIRDGRGTAVRMIGAMMDISARKEAEERFEQIATRIGEVFWLTDVATKAMLYISPAYETIWGRPTHSVNSPGHSWLDAVHPEDRDRVAHAARIEQEKGTYDIEYRITRSDGASRWIHDRAFPVHDDDGTVYRIAGVARDITDQKLAVERARESEEQLRHSQKMEAVGSLAGGVAHDFNNLLTVIVTYADLMLSMPALDVDLHRDATEIRLAADRATALTRQLLAFGRKQVLHPTVLRVNDVVERMHGMLSRVIREDIVVETRLGIGVRPIRADWGQLEQVIMNLALNARDAMPKGGRLLIETRAMEADEARRASVTLAPSDDHVVLSITDTGTGIDPATRDRLFEPFFTTKEVGKGTGLGLSTVYGIVQQSGGTIDVTSEPGHGSTFNVYFPCYRGDDEVAKALSTPPAVELPTRATVLLVEDDPAVRGAVRIMLERVGYDAVEAPDAITALGMMRAAPSAYDVVLSDAMMPDMSGVELAQLLRTEHADKPVVIMSGYSEDAVTGADRLPSNVLFIEKPFRAAKLSQALTSVLGHREA